MLTEAAMRLCISRCMLYRRTDEGALQVFTSSANRRERLLRRRDVETPPSIESATRVAAHRRMEGDKNE